MEKDFYDLSGAAAEALAENADEIVLRQKFKEIEQILNDAANLPKVIRGTIAGALQINVARIKRNAVIDDKESWEAAFEVVSFTYETIRHQLYGFKNEALLINLNKIFKERLAEIALEYRNNVPRSRLSLAEYHIATDIRTATEKQAASLQSMRTLITGRKRKRSNPPR